MFTRLVADKRSKHEIGSRQSNQYHENSDHPKSIRRQAVYTNFRNFIVPNAFEISRVIYRESFYSWPINRTVTDCEVESRRLFRNLKRNL